MGLDSASIWAADVVAAIDAVGVDDSAPVTAAQIKAVWEAIKQVTIDQLGQSSVAPGAFVNSGGPVTGEGGPVT